MKRIMAFCLTLTLCLSVFAFTGCSCNGANNADDSTPGNMENNNEPINLTLWGSADDQQMLREMADEFIKNHTDKNIEITVRVSGEDVARDEALKDIETAADVFAITNDQLGALVNADAVYENTRYAEEIYNTRTESAINAAKIGDKLYGYPSSAETYFLFYDKSKYTEDEVSSLETMLNKDQANGTAPFAMDFSDAYFSSLFFLTSGCKIYGENGQDPTTVTFNTEQGLAAAKYIASLKARGAEDISGDVAASRFKSGKLAAYISGSWKTEAFREALGENLGVAKLPTIKINGSDMNMVSFAGGKMYVVKSTTKHPLEAMALAAFLTNEDNQLKRYNDRTILPNNKNLSSHEDIVSNPSIAAEIAQLEFSVATPSITQMSKYWDPVAAFTKDVFDGKIPEAELESRLDRLVADITA